GNRQAGLLWRFYDDHAIAIWKPFRRKFINLIERDSRQEFLLQIVFVIRTGQRFIVEKVSHVLVCAAAGFAVLFFDRVPLVKPQHILFLTIKLSRRETKLCHSFGLAQDRVQSPFDAVFLYPSKESRRVFRSREKVAAPSACIDEWRVGLLRDF